MSTVAPGRSITPAQAAQQEAAALAAGIPQEWITGFLGQNPYDTNRLQEAYLSGGPRESGGYNTDLPDDPALRRGLIEPDPRLMAGWPGPGAPFAPSPTSLRAASSSTSRQASMGPPPLTLGDLLGLGATGAQSAPAPVTAPRALTLADLIGWRGQARGR